MRNKAAAYHLLFWISIYTLWVLVFSRYSFSLTRTMTIEFCYLLFITADYYVLNSFIIPRILLRKNYALFTLSAILLIALSAWLRALVAIQMNLHFFKVVTAPSFTVLYFNSVINIFFWVLAITLGKAIIDRIQDQYKIELLEKERTKNELNFLKAQINPHALFNSLNTIYGHIDKSNQLARNTLLQFSELLRYQLYDCAEEKVSLDKELSYIRNYVAFHQLRKSERCHVTLDIAEPGNNREIAPLLLVVLIENAFKFVSNSTDKENQVTIRLSTTGNILRALISNTTEQNGQPLNSDGNGIGLTNLKRRLSLLYPGKHTLSAGFREDIYEANLTIDLS